MEVGKGVARLKASPARLSATAHTMFESRGTPARALYCSFHMVIE